MKSIRLSRVDVSLLLVMLLFGLPMILVIPPGAGYDEEDHLVRVWELSRFSFIPGQLSAQELRYPTVFRDFAYRQQGSTGVIGRDFWQTYARTALEEHGFVRREINTKSVYSPTLLLPQAAAMGLFGRLANLPALPVFYLCRLASLLSYLLLTWLAIRLIPFGKWLLLLLAVSPMALFQAATITPDAISNGIGFLFVAGCLRQAAANEIGRRETVYLLILIVLLFLAKLNIIPLVLLPFLLIPPANFRSKRLYIVLLVGTLILFLVEVIGWNLIASRNFDALVLDEASPRDQVLYILEYPLTFLLIVIRDAITNAWMYLHGWINGYGYYYWTPPWVVSVLYLLSLAAVILMNPVSSQMTKKARLAFLLAFLAGYIATVASIYITYASVGAAQVFGVQGRYFIPLALPLFLGVSSVSWKRPVLSPSLFMIFLTAALALNLLGLYLAFHVPCGSTFYETGLCYRPLFKDLPSDVRPSEPISGETSLIQEFEVACDGLTEVRVLVTPSTRDALGITRFIVQDQSSNQVLLDKSIANGPIRAETRYPLRFEPDWRSAGKEYTLEILGTSPSPEQGLRVFYTPQSEFDLGDLYENGEMLDEDLVLQYGCITGLRKLWLIGVP